MGKWSRKEKESEYKLSEEIAETQVQELLEFYDVSVNDNAEEKERKAAENNFNELQRYYRMGKLENKRDETLGFCVVQYLENGQTLTYREMKTKDLSAIEGFDENHNISRCKAILGKLCGLGVDVIDKLNTKDRKAAFAIGLVFIIA
jgi:hypothetical protein